MCLAQNAKKLEAGNGKLGDLVSRSVPHWLPDGTAEFLDDVVGEVLEYIQSRHHLVVVEGFCRPLAKEKDLLEHINSGLADPSLEGNSILLQVIIAVFVLVLISDGRFVRVLTPITPSLSTCLKGLKLNARHQHFLPGLGVRSIGISPSPSRRFGIFRHCEGQVRSSRMTFIVSCLCNGRCESMVCASGCAAVYSTWV
jgi:hypothetical protein